MDIFDKVVLGLTLVGGISVILFIWALGYTMLVQVGAL